MPAVGRKPTRGENNAFLWAQSAVEESFKGVTFNVKIRVSASMSTQFADREYNLKLAACSSGADVHRIIEKQLFGPKSAATIGLFFEGEPLPRHLPIYQVGIDEAETIDVISLEPRQLSRAESCMTFGRSAWKSRCVSRSAVSSDALPSDLAPPSDSGRTSWTV